MGLSAAGRRGPAPAEVDDTASPLDQPLRRGEGRAVVRLKKQPGKMAKLNALEKYVLKFAEVGEDRRFLTLIASSDAFMG